jgi:hypothetical protein
MLQKQAQHLPQGIGLSRRLASLIQDPVQVRCGIGARLANREFLDQDGASAAMLPAATLALPISG